MEYVIAIAVLLVLWILLGKGYTPAKVRNRIKAWANDRDDNCIKCRHCYVNGQGCLACRLSQAKNITPETKKRCCER